MTTRMRLFRRDHGHSVCLRALVFVLVLLVILLVASRVESKTWSVESADSCETPANAGM